MYLRRLSLSGQLCGVKYASHGTTRQMTISLSLTIVSELFPELQPALVTVLLRVSLDIISAFGLPRSWRGNDNHLQSIQHCIWLIRFLSYPK